MTRVGLRFTSLLRSLLIVCFLSIGIDAVTGTALAGQSRVELSGVVRDTSGAVVTEARVEALVAGRSVAAVTTDKDGRYRLEVPIGAPIAVRASRDGFADEYVELPGRHEPLTRDLVLRVGGLSDTLVVTASRNAESRANLLQSVTVTTKAEMEALGSSSLADLMRFVPGVNIETTGREGALTSMFARGGESDYNLVLVDGVRVNLSGGQFDFSRIGTGEIERVEVLRGAQSALWGSDAMGSVVQIFTKRAGPGDAPFVSASIEGGTFDTWRGDARLIGGVRGIVDYQVGTTQRRTDGAFADLLPEDDRFRQSAFDASLGVALGTRANLRSSLRKSDSNGRTVGPITYGSRDSGGVYDTDDLSWHANVSHAIGGRFTGTGTINYFRYGNYQIDTIADPPYATYAILDGTPNALFPRGSRLVRLIDEAEFMRLSAAGALPAPGQFLASRATADFASTQPSITQFRRPAIRYQGDYVWGGSQRLSAGYEWERERRARTAADPEVELDNNSVFVQQQFNARDRWFVAVGGRVDSKETYDNFFSPKLSAGGFVVPFRQAAVSSVKVFGNVGRGIKSPTFGERFGGPFADPDPNLKVEMARTADLGAEATFLDQRVRGLITYFNNDYTDQIAFRSGVVGDGIPEFLNIDGSDARGWELEAALQRPFRGLTAMATYAYVDTRVVTSVQTSQQFQPGQPLLRRPRHSGTIRAAYARGRATVNVNMRIVGQRHDNSFLSLRTVPNAERPTAITTDITINPGYVVAGLGLDYRVHDAVTIFLRSDNVGDTEYDSALGYPALPRAVVIGARFRLSLRR
jgi:vitamin B12 transporter